MNMLIEYLYRYLRAVGQMPRPLGLVVVGVHVLAPGALAVYLLARAGHEPTALSASAALFAGALLTNGILRLLIRHQRSPERSPARTKAKS